MGVNLHFYVYYGVKIEYDESLSEAYEEVYESIDGASILFDGMSGEYVVIGKRLWDSGDARYAYDESDGFAKIPMDLDYLANIRKEFKDMFRERFPNFMHIVDQKWELLCFPHFS